MEGKSRILVVLAICLMVLWAPIAQAATVYVKTDGNNNNNGSSWTLAKQTISAAISAASSGDEIWVKTGIYSENIAIPSGIYVFGGFAGDESYRDYRDWATNTTTLDGGFISVTGTSAASALDGFKIINIVDRFQAAISLTDDVTFSHNIVTDCSDSYILISCSGSVKIVNNAICDNLSDEGWAISGGAAIVNNTICNSVGDGGIAVANGGTVANNIVAFNIGCGVSPGNDLLYNCVYFNPQSDYYGFPLEWTVPATEINADPLFVDQENGDWHLESTSPCINISGANATITSTSIPEFARSKDLDGNPRILYENVDVGAYELVDTTAPSTPVVTDDGDYTSNTTQLHASWTSSDPESGIVEYQYAIGTTPGGTDVVDWTTPSPATSTSVTRTGLSLDRGTYYYISAKAKNGANIWSSVGTSDGILPIRITSVATSSGYTVALANDGTVWTWGLNDHGQLGDGTTIAHYTPAQVPNLTGIVAVDALCDHTVALKSDGTVWAWGYNALGQLGDGTTTERHSPVQVSNLSGITAVSAGDRFTAARKSDGTVWTWGYNGHGQLGIGNTTNHSTPVEVTGLSGVTDIALGQAHAVARKGNGTVWTWGENQCGQLGINNKSDRYSPVQVLANLSSPPQYLTGITKIEAGWQHTLASDGTVWTWGYNGRGQIGNNTTIDREYPFNHSDITSVSAITAGYSHTIALVNDGTFWAWGSDTYGELGDGCVNTERHTPIHITTITDIVSITAGHFCTAVIKNDGTLWMWGLNAQGQLGDGTTNNHTTPTQVSGL